MSNDQKRQLIEEYNALEKALNLESSKASASRITMNEYEDKMAAIETRFQQSGDDIRLYL